MGQRGARGSREGPRGHQRPPGRQSNFRRGGKATSFQTVGQNQLFQYKVAINFDFRSGTKKSGHLDYPLQSYGPKLVNMPKYAYLQIWGHNQHYINQ